MAIAFIGGGNMASAIIGGLIAQGRSVQDMLVIDPDEIARERIKERFGVTALPALTEALPTNSACVLAVKPQVMQPVCQSIASHIGDALVISIAAGTRLDSLAAWLHGHRRSVRVMPNTPALVGLGAAGMYADPSVSARDRQTTEEIVTAVGIAIWVDQEQDIDTVTAISGSGPAYVFRWMEAMQAAATELGLPEDKALPLIMQTLRGAAELAMQSADGLAQLRENVTSPGGTTAAGLAAMNESGVTNSIVSGVRAAHARSIELGQG
ncbi:MAG: pyrroline-5-carboxylate reductase [Burkholderiaceae bacterium]